MLYYERVNSNKLGSLSRNRSASKTPLKQSSKIMGVSAGGMSNAKSTSQLLLSPDVANNNNNTINA